MLNGQFPALGCRAGADGWLVGAEVLGTLQAARFSRRREPQARSIAPERPGQPKACHVLAPRHAGRGVRGCTGLIAYAYSLLSADACGGGRV